MVKSDSERIEQLHKALKEKEIAILKYSIRIQQLEAGLISAMPATKLLSAGFKKLFGIHAD